MEDNRLITTEFRNEDEEVERSLRPKNLTEYFEIGRAHV